MSLTLKTTCRYALQFALFRFHGSSTFLPLMKDGNVGHLLIAFLKMHNAVLLSLWKVIVLIDHSRHGLERDLTNCFKSFSYNSWQFLFIYILYIRTTFHLQYIKFHYFITNIPAIATFVYICMSFVHLCLVSPNCSCFSFAYSCMHAFVY